PLSPEFANNSSLACQLIIIGIYINGFAFLFEVVIQGSGRPDLTAKLHLFELLLYIPYLIFSIYMWQILGASIAWILRTSISTIGHAFIAQRCLNNSSFNIKLTSPDHSK
ncbi:MAG: polysaccharide biosynthesis C-terminal domain-containing protein, partial [Dolichospermum sp.]